MSQPPRYAPTTSFPIQPSNGAHALVGGAPATSPNKGGSSMTNAWKSPMGSPTVSREKQIIHLTADQMRSMAHTGALLPVGRSSPGLAGESLNSSSTHARPPAMKVNAKQGPTVYPVGNSGKTMIPVPMASLSQGKTPMPLAPVKGSPQPLHQLGISGAKRMMKPQLLVSSLLANPSQAPPALHNGNSPVNPRRDTPLSVAERRSSSAYALPSFPPDEPGGSTVSQNSFLSSAPLPQLHGSGSAAPVRAVSPNNRFAHLRLSSNDGSGLGTQHERSVTSPSAIRSKGYKVATSISGVSSPAQGGDNTPRKTIPETENALAHPQELQMSPGVAKPISPSASESATAKTLGQLPKAGARKVLSAPFKQSSVAIPISGRNPTPSAPPGNPTAPEVLKVAVDPTPSAASFTAGPFAATSFWANNSIAQAASSTGALRYNREGSPHHSNVPHNESNENRTPGILRVPSNTVLKNELPEVGIAPSEAPTPATTLRSRIAKFQVVDSDGDSSDTEGAHPQAANTVPQSPMSKLIAMEVAPALESMLPIAPCPDGEVGDATNTDGHPQPSPRDPVSIVDTSSPEALPSDIRATADAQNVQDSPVLLPHDVASADATPGKGSTSLPRRSERASASVQEGTARAQPTVPRNVAAGKKRNADVKSTPLRQRDISAVTGANGRCSTADGKRPEKASHSGRLRSPSMNAVKPPSSAARTKQSPRPSSSPSLAEAAEDTDTSVSTLGAPFNSSSPSEIARTASVLTAASGRGAKDSRVSERSSLRNKALRARHPSSSKDRRVNTVTNNECDGDQSRCPPDYNNDISSSSSTRSQRRHHSTYISRDVYRLYNELAREHTSREGRAHMASSSVRRYRGSQARMRCLSEQPWASSTPRRRHGSAFRVAHGCESHTNEPFSSRPLQSDRIHGSLGLPWRSPGRASGGFDTVEPISRPLGYIGVGGGRYARVGNSPYTRDAVRRAASVDEYRQHSLSVSHSTPRQLRREESAAEGGGAVTTVRRTHSFDFSPRRLCADDRERGTSSYSSASNLYPACKSLAMHPYCLVTDSTNSSSHRRDRSLEPHRPVAEDSVRSGDTASKRNYTSQMNDDSPALISRMEGSCSSTRGGSSCRRNNGVCESCSPHRPPHILKSNCTSGRSRIRATSLVHNSEQHTASTSSHPLIDQPLLQLVPDIPSSPSRKPSSPDRKPGTNELNLARQAQETAPLIPSKVNSSMPPRIGKRGARTSSAHYSPGSLTRSPYGIPPGCTSPTRRSKVPSTGLTICPAVPNRAHMTGRRERGHTPPGEERHVRHKSPVPVSGGRTSDCDLKGTSSGDKRFGRTSSQSVWLDQALALAKQGAGAVVTPTPRRESELRGTPPPSIPVIDLRKEFRPSTTHSGGSFSARPRSSSATMGDRIRGMSFRHMTGVRAASARADAAAASPLRQQTELATRSMSTPSAKSPRKVVIDVPECLPYKYYSTLTVKRADQPSPWALAPARYSPHSSRGRTVARRKVPSEEISLSSPSSSRMPGHADEADHNISTLVEEVRLDDQNRPYLVIKEIPRGEAAEAQKASVQRLARPKPVFVRASDTPLC